MNGDGVIDDLGVNIVNNHLGEIVWKDITTQVLVISNVVYVYGSTDHFSLIGIH